MSLHKQAWYFYKVKRTEHRQMQIGLANTMTIAEAYQAGAAPRYQTFSTTSVGTSSR